MDATHRPTRRAVCRAGAGCALASLLAPWPAHAADDGHEVTVRVERRGNLIVLDVETEVAASVDDVWAVLVDYDHMAGFMPNLTASAIVQRDGDSLQVAQKGEKRVLFMRFAFAGTKAVELVPKREIRTALVQGDFRSYQSSTRLINRGNGRIGIVQHGQYEPTRWVPPAIGPALIESETREHYRAFVREILKRQQPNVPR